MSMAKEFKEFISRGNVVDLAVGVIIGGAFGAIVTSLVKDVVMPPIGYLMSGIDFSSLKYTIPHSAVRGPDPKVVPPDLNPAHFIDIKKPVDISYGLFLQTVISFLIISFVIFLVVKGVNALKRKEAEKPAEPAAPTTDQQLLMEIRDLLAKRS